MQLFQGHDTHSHPLEEYTGCIGTIQAPAGHGGDGDDLFLVVEARYTDRGAPGVGPFTGREAAVLQPRRIEAEHFDSAGGVQVEATGDRAGGGESIGFIENGDYISIGPILGFNLDAIRYRVASAGAGGTIEVRRDNQDGPLVSIATITPTGDWQVYKNVTAPLTAFNGTHELFFNFLGAGGGLFNINWIEFLRLDDGRPTAVGDSYFVGKNATLTIGGAGVIVNDFDGQLDPLKTALETAPEHGAVTLNADGSFTYAPQVNYVGPDSFTYRAVQGVTTTVAPLGATWHYLDDGSNQGTQWRDRLFNDASWKTGAGQLGYGDGDETAVVDYGPNAGQKYVTTYFRHHFVVDDPDEFASLKVRLIRDDGVAVFLNGQLVGYDSLANGAGFNATAEGVIGDAAEEAFIEFTIDPRDLVQGDNVLAVEVHQSSGDSSDLSFDLELTGVLRSAPVTVLLEVQGPLNGDTNGDNLVDLDDLNNVRNHFGGEGLGDTDGDNDVDLDDLNNVRNHFGASTGQLQLPQAEHVPMRPLSAQKEHFGNLKVTRLQKSNAAIDALFTSAVDALLERYIAIARIRS